VLAGARTPPAPELVDFLLSPEVQAALPDSMYVFPVAPGTPLPADWAKFAHAAEPPTPSTRPTIAEHRDEWLTEWSDVTSR
jgi:thiamine transport system substrate-binding protein